MLRRFVKPQEYFQLKRTVQISESHCGPAVIQMLLSNLGIPVTQEAVAEAGCATALIEMHGMRVDQLATAVLKLAPGAQFWSKEKARLSDLVRLVNEFRYPVGVEWQGIFEDEDSEDDSEDQSDYGHYSVITYADPEKRELIIVDPYKDFIDRDRILGFNTFANRWWDINEVTDPKTGRKKYVEDEHVLFIVTLKDATFPHELKMKQFNRIGKQVPSWMMTASQDWMKPEPQSDSC
jgi:hypothetical protein